MNLDEFRELTKDLPEDTLIASYAGQDDLYFSKRRFDIKSMRILGHGDNIYPWDLNSTSTPSKTLKDLGIRKVIVIS